MLGKGITQCGFGCRSIYASANGRSIISQLSSRNVVAPVAISPLRQIRGIETERLTPSSGHKILVEQRKRRPVSPHLSIYRLQINYFTSPFHRITGCLLSGAFYCFGAAYLVAQLFGWHLDSATLVAAFGNLPAGAKIAAKFVMAWPLTFHCVNGVGHLIWDTGRRYSKRAIVTQGWTIVGVSLVGAGYLTTMV